MNVQRADGALIRGRLVLLLRIVLGATVLCLALLAWTPPFDRDGLIHHLQVPKLYLQFGGMRELPHLPFSYYPMNLDLLYMGALRLGSDILPKYIHMAFALGSALLLHQHLKKRLSSIHACLGATFFLGIPIIVKLAISAYVDLGLVFFSTAAMLLLFRWTASRRLRHLILAGICCGLGLGTKYNGLLILFLLTSAVPILLIRSEENPQGKHASRAACAAAIFCLAALLAASPWLIRNMAWTGNPVYPLFDGLFNPSGTRIAAAAGQESSNKVRGVFATRRLLYQENLWQLLLLPARIFFEGRDDDPRYFDGQLNPFLLLLPLFAFICPKSCSRQLRFEQMSMAVFCLLYFLFAFNTSVLRIRYLAPMVPFLVILSMHGLNNLEMLTRKHVESRHFVLLAWLLPTSMLLAWNGIYIWHQFKEIEPLSYISGRLSREEYLAKHLPEYRIMQHINSSLPDSTRILCIFMGWRGYYLNRPHLFEHQDTKNGLLAWLQLPGMTAGKINQMLMEKGIDYLLIRKDLLDRWLLMKTDATQNLWGELETKQHIIQFSSHLQYVLYRVQKNIQY